MHRVREAACRQPGAKDYIAADKRLRDFRPGLDRTLGLPTQRDIPAGSRETRGAEKGPDLAASRGHELRELRGSHAATNDCRRHGFRACDFDFVLHRPSAGSLTLAAEVAWC